MGRKKMQVCKILASYLFMILLPVGVMDWGNGIAAEANTDTRDDFAADEMNEPSQKGKKPKKKKGGKGKRKAKKEKKAKKQAKQKLDPELRDTRFKELEEFHQSWFNLSPVKVKKSLESAIKFCKIACTSDQCTDSTVSNNCHLMCPTSTLKNCPDLNTGEKTTENAPPEANPQSSVNQQGGATTSVPIEENSPGATDQQGVATITVNGVVQQPQMQSQMPMQAQVPMQQSMMPAQQQEGIPSQPNVIPPAN